LNLWNHKKILHVDDDECNLEFTKLFLRGIDPELEIHNATSPHEALQLMEKEHFNCVITDYRMPNLNGIELAQKIKSRYDIPIILFTGQGSEEVAEQAFQNGIDDYLRKESGGANFQVLYQRVIVALNKLITEKTLEEALERYKHFLEYTHDLVQSVRMDGSYEYVNKSWMDTLGYNLDDINDLNIFDVIHPSQREHCKTMFQCVINGETLENIETKFITKHNKTIDLKGKATPRYIDNKVVATHGFFTKIVT